MPRKLQRMHLRVGGLALLGGLLGCSVVTGLDKLSIENASSSGSGGSGSVTGCTTNAECTEQATQAAAADAAVSNADAGADKVPAICIQSTGQCVTLVSEDCSTVTGDYENDKAIVIGSLFATQGATAAQNIPRQQSATLAVEEINNAGGIPTSVAGVYAPLVMVSCNTSVNAIRAATHLASEIGVPAIVGPNTSQDTLNVSNQVTIQAGTVVISPSAQAASIADLLDNDLTWLMIPLDNQRGQLMMLQINSVEASLRAQRLETNVKLSIIYRNDVTGIGTLNSLNTLQINGAPLTDPVNAGSASGNVQIVPYDPTQPNQNAIVTQQAAFAPDIVVLAGTAETVTQLMTPLEQQWTAGANRPYYFFIDPSKGPDLLAAVAGKDDLRLRVRGTGVTPGPDSIAVWNTFSLDYLARYGSSPTASGTGPSYDAVYSIAYAAAYSLAATKDLPLSGVNVAKGLRKLAGGLISIQTGTQKLLAAFQVLASGQNIDGTGTYCPLDWDGNGSVKGGTIEMWCVGTSGSTPLFQSSGLTFDIATQDVLGTYAQCGQ